MTWGWPVMSGKAVVIRLVQKDAAGVTETKVVTLPPTMVPPVADLPIQPGYPKQLPVPLGELGARVVVIGDGSKGYLWLRCPHCGNECQIPFGITPKADPPLRWGWNGSIQLSSVRLWPSFSWPGHCHMQFLGDGMVSP